MPVADIALDPKSIDRVRQACTNLINSPGGSADARSLAFIQRGSMYRRQQKYDLALADFDQAIRYDPKSASGYTGRGNALRLLGRLDESIAAHSEAIRLEPNNAMAYSNRGNALGDKKTTSTRSLTLIWRSKSIRNMQRRSTIAPMLNSLPATNQARLPTIARR
jgi:tetratricopeptide (TPR) repeat protein